MKTCKTCAYWVKPNSDNPDDYYAEKICVPIDPDTYQPMNRIFESRMCKMPTQAFCESPVEKDGFALADGSQYMAVLATAEDFGCVKHSEYKK